MSESHLSDWHLLEVVFVADDYPNGLKYGVEDISKIINMKPGEVVIVSFNVSPRSEIRIDGLSVRLDDPRAKRIVDALAAMPGDRR